MFRGDMYHHREISRVYSSHMRGRAERTIEQARKRLPHILTRTFHSVRSQRRDGAGKADGTEEKEDERVDRKGHRRKAIETDGDTGVSRTDPTVVDAIEGRTGEAGGAGAGAGGGGGGKRKRGRPAAKGEAKEREKARQRAERSRRITSTLDLVETLVSCCCWCCYG